MISIPTVSRISFQMTEKGLQIYQKSLLFRNKTVGRNEMLKCYKIMGICQIYVEISKVTMCVYEGLDIH